VGVEYARLIPGSRSCVISDLAASACSAASKVVAVNRPTADTAGADDRNERDVRFNFT
jgi:hypothetical protein